MGPIYVRRWHRHGDVVPRLTDVVLLAVALVMLVLWGLVACAATVLHWLSRPRVAWAWSRIPHARVVTVRDR